MKVLVTGAAGMLGTDVCADLAARGHEVVATDQRAAEGFTPLDITDTAATRSLLRQARPDAVIHCAAWTDVDGAERTPEPAYRVNALGSWNLAFAADEINAWLLAVSTDFVFDGFRETPTPYTEFDATNPLGAYGASKEAGERLIRQTLPGRHIIARTAWLYGVHGRNFVYTIRRLGRERDQVPVVADQVGCPTHTRDLSRKLIDLMEDPLPGTYHVCSAGECSWYEFARAIVAKSGIDTEIVPISGQEYADRFNSPTRRPDYSAMRRLALEMRGMDDLPAWEDALDEFLRIVPADR